MSAVKRFKDDPEIPYLIPFHGIEDKQLVASQADWLFSLHAILSRQAFLPETLGESAVIRPPDLSRSVLIDGYMLRCPKALTSLSF